MALAFPRTFSMNICLATNRKYVRISQVMLFSLFCNNQDADIHIYLFHCELTDFSGNDCVVCEDILINRVYKDYYRNLFEELSGFPSPHRSISPLTP